MWDDVIVPELKSRPTLALISLFELLQEKYPGHYPDTLTRTLQRRVKAWKLQFGNEQEVMFRQEHLPGRQVLSDFTHLKDVEITVAGEPLVHKSFHFRLVWSR